MPDAFIIDSCRTPHGIGKQGKGALAHLHPQHLGSTVLRAHQEPRVGLSPIYLTECALSDIAENPACFGYTPRTSMVPVAYA